LSIEATSDMVVEKTTSGRTALNFWIDLLTGISFLILLGTSSLMKFVLPPGTCDGDGVKVWLGHSRHWWGDIHFWVAVLMLILMVVHVWLHWGWVCRIWAKVIGSGKAFQTWALIAGMVAVLVVPFAVPAQHLDVMVAPDHYMAHADDEDHAGESAAVAPCGIEGLSCSDCPAADDRLFGGGCASSDKEDDAAAKDADCTDSSDCSSCEFAEQCGSGEDEAQGSDA